MTILFESAIRVTLIAAFIALVLFAMRIKSASALHAVWTGVVVLLLLLPAWVAWGPKASLALLPPDRTPVVALLPTPLPAGLADATPRTSPIPIPSPAREGGGYMAIYLLGVGVFLLRLAIGTVRATRLTSASCVVPVTVGLLHPRIILPECFRDWPQAQLDAVLAHEGEHVRRRDPLFQWLALLNRAFFWFHPLAWWLERRLSGLAEEACDAAVIARGCGPREYSEYLLDLARSVERAGTRIEAVGMAMPGIGLKHRIRRILSGVPAPRISRPRMACTVAVCAGAAAILAAGTLVRAQSVANSNTQAGPEFEAAAIKPSDPQHVGAQMFFPGGGRFTAMTATVKNLMGFAYELRDHQISGGPSWIDAARYDISAKGEGAASDDQIRLMLQRLLAGRFQLRFHREVREQPVYSLVVSKNGPKLHEVKAAGRGIGVRNGQLNGFGAPTRIFADVLSNQLGRTVSDETGLNGFYDFTLTWTPDYQTPDGTSPSLFTAVLEQLGLRLVATKGQVEFFVIDHIERPSEN